MTRRAAYFLILAILWTGAAGPARAAVTLRSETEIDRPIVKLSDVFDGLPADIDAPIARAPAPGHDITYDSNVLDRLARQYKLDWKPESPADHIVVKTLGTKITNAILRTAVAEKIKALDVRGDIDVTFDNHAAEITVPGESASDISLDNFEYDAVSKRFHSELRMEGFGGPIDLPISGRIGVRHNVPVLVRRLEAGSLVGASDIDWVSVSEEHMSGLITSANELVDHELRRDQDADQPVRLRDVMPPRLVARGALVTMKVESAFMTVTAQGRALQDGKLGDVVRIKNTQSNRLVEGTVEGPGLVRIQAGQRVAAADAPERQE